MDEQERPGTLSFLPLLLQGYLTYEKTHAP